MKNGNALGWGLAIGVGLLLIGSSKSTQPPRPKPKQLSNPLLDHAKRCLVFAANTMGVKPPKLVVSDEVENAESNGTVIRINLRWLRRTIGEQCDGDACLHSIVLGVLAHELAHHVYQDARDPAYGWGHEFRADRIAARVLAAHGVDPEHFAKLVASFTEHGSATHPPGTMRYVEILAAYLEFRGSLLS